MTNTIVAVINGTTYTGTLAAATPPPPSPYARPAGNTGTGLYVAGGRLNNPDGSEFRLRGVNINHYDNAWNLAGVDNTKANAVRIFLEVGYGATYTQLAAVVAAHIAAKRVVVAVCAAIPPGTAGTSGDQNIADLETCVQGQWVVPAATWLPVLNAAGIVNLCNEFGPANSAPLAAAYITAVTQMRAAGYTCPLMIDPGGSGQDEVSITNFAAQVLAADPQKNLIFAYHMYGGTTPYQCPVASISPIGVIALQSTAAAHPFDPAYTGPPANNWSGMTQVEINGVVVPVLQNVYGSPGAWTLQASVNPTGPVILPTLPTVKAGDMCYDWRNYTVRMLRLSALKAQGICVAITEFGPGNNWGPSPTMVTPAQVIGAAEANDLGWIAWAWDDNNQANGTGVDWFNLQVNVETTYTGQEAQLTPYGQVVVAALAEYATPSTIFAS